MPYASRSSQIPDLQKNSDGSVDIYIGPKAPDRSESQNLILMFRFYGPTPQLFDKRWKLPDGEEVK
jgi:hypothetical protein